MACGNDGWLAGMRWDEGYGVFLWRNSSIPLLAALASPFAVRRGVVGAVLGGISGVSCVLRFACTCLLRGAKGRGGLPPVSVARVDVRCHARIVLRSSQAWG